jgi:hypothetical protein
MPRRKSVASPAALRASLRRRARNFYRSYNLAKWPRCYALVDPRLRENDRVQASPHADSLAAFRRRYGDVTIWHIDVSLHTDVTNNKHDDRPFAYVYVFWQDDNKAFHVFRERWVCDSGRWYTRVAGLVAHERTSSSA